MQFNKQNFLKLCILEDEEPVKLKPNSNTTKESKEVAASTPPPPPQPVKTSSLTSLDQS